MARTNAPYKAVWLIFLLIPIVLDAVSWAGEYTGAEPVSYTHLRAHET